ncbi:MAG TPA: hypothetical protein VEW93_01925 [Acidimicrobiales bacterium]|nr:hypothetical protein [Acidimicrobiales bacterium]
MRRPWRRAFLLGLAVGVVVALLRAGRRPAPGPEALGAPTPALPPPRSIPSAPPAGAPATPAPAAGPVEPRPAPDAGGANRNAPTATEVREAAPATGGDAGDRAWRPPVAGACPEGYPVKAKQASGIFHVPGGLSYDRTHPDRCYRSVGAAEADGFRAAKR